MTFYRTPFEEWVMQWGSLVGLVIAALALIFAAWRFVWIKKVLTQGTAINGTVEDVDIIAARLTPAAPPRSSSGPESTPTTR